VSKLALGICTRLALIVVAAIATCAVRAGTTVIHVETEGSGDLVRRGSPDQVNLNGAMVWNGAEWIVNSTWAHKFFVDTRTGQRLKDYSGPPVFTGTSPIGALGTFLSYRVTRSVSLRSKRALAGNGTYRWVGVDYEITDLTSGRVLLLRSRGAGAGLWAAYFDVFIEDQVVGGGVQTTAFVGDPAWFTIPMRPAEAAQLASLEPYRTGDLPGAVTRQGTNRADYYLDIASGADLGPAGVGKSFELVCAPLPGRVASSSPAYVTRFKLKYMDSSGNLQKLELEPALVSETFEPDAGVPTPLLVPVVLSLDGAAGSSYTSELTLTNRSTVDARLTLVYTASVGGGSGSGSATLGAGRQSVVPDAIAYLRSLGVPIPEAGGRLGTLRVDVLGPPAGQVAVTARTTTPVPEGRAGLAYAALPASALLLGPSVVPGLRAGTDDRSNLALVNASTVGDLSVRMTVASGDPAGPGVGSFTSDPLAPGGFRQYTLDDLLTRSGLTLTSPNVWVLLTPSSNATPYDAYGVVNDQRNSDGSFLPAIPEAAASGRTSLVLPVVVETASAAPFTTEVVATNTSTTAKALNLSFLTTYGTSPGATATDTLSLAAGEQRIIPGLVDYLRSRQVTGIGPKGTTFAGSLLVTASSGDLDGVLVGARTTAPGSVTGRYGLYYVALAPREAAPAAAWVFGLRQDDENRTNLALVNAGSGDVRLRIEIFRADTGAVAATVEGEETTLPAGGWRQVDRILEARAPGVTSAYARVSRVSGDAPFVVYAVVNDGARAGERSGDGAYVPMVVE